jgi:DNA-binding NarL/FixJ family response regulator
MTKLLVIDDHDVVRQGLITALRSHGFEQLDSAGTLKQARSKIAAFNPNAIIVDLNLPDGSGFEIVEWVRRLSSQTAIVVLSLNDPTGFAKLARASGANAYLSKTQSIDEIVSVINFAISNPGSFTSQLVDLDKGATELTAREFDVLYLIANGLSNVQISATLFLSLSTVKTHISAILRKLDASNRTGAVTKAREKGLLLE